MNAGTSRKGAVGGWSKKDKGSCSAGGALSTWDRDGGVVVGSSRLEGAALGLEGYLLVWRDAAKV